MNASYVSVAPGYPVFRRRRTKAVVPIRGAPGNDLCRHAREAVRRRRDEKDAAGGS